MNVNPIKQFRADIKAALPTLGLGDEKAQERMSSVLMIAVERDPALMFADRQSLISAVRQCANHGLVPDGNEATLQVYNTKVKVDGVEKWIKKVQYQPMVRGIINRIIRSGKVLTIWAEVVYKGEEFSIDISQGDRRPKHNPDYFARSGDAKDIIGVYSVAKLANGTVDCEPLPRSEIDKIRNVAKTTKIWDVWFTEKAKVGAIRRHSKRLPLSAEDMDFILNHQEHDLDEARDVTPVNEPDMNLAQKLAQDGQQIEHMQEMPRADLDNAEDAELVDATPHWTMEVDTSEAFPGDEAFDEGVKAFKAGLKRTQCPHSDHTVAAQWLGGYDQAEALTNA
jgi:phage RecT family recombinase